MKQNNSRNEQGAMPQGLPARCEIGTTITKLLLNRRPALDYILDTFHTVKRKYEAKFAGDYRTKRTILEIYDALAEAMKNGRPYQTLLNPPPADPRCCHPPKTS